MTLAEFVSHIIDTRQISQSELCSMLGYKSPTTLLRILKDHVRDTTFSRFESDMLRVLSLTEDERETLHNCILKRRYGDDYVVFAQEIRTMLSRRPLRSCDRPRIFTEDGSSFDLFDHCMHKDRLIVHVFNCFHGKIMNTVRDIAEADRIVHHYITQKYHTTKFIHALNAILDVYKTPNYSAYRLLESDDTSGLQEADMMMIRYTDDAGHVQTELVLFPRPELGLLLKAPLIIEELIPAAESCEPLKPSYGTGIDSIANLLQSLSDLEKDCVIYDLKPDPCIAYIPTGVLLSAFTDSGFANVVGQGALVDLYEKVHAREINIYKKKQPSHCIMKYSALRAFAKTGLLSDHLPGMRPFTLRERILILEKLLDANLVNPYYNLYLLDDDSLLPDMNICCYYGRGLFLSELNNTYIGNDAAQLVICPPDDFHKAFAQYCKEELIARHALSTGATTEMIRELIRQCHDDLMDHPS